MTNKQRTNLIVKGALLGAVAMVVKYFIDIPIIPQIMHFRPHAFIVYAAGFLYGPVVGGVVGLIADFAGMAKYGPSLFTLASILMGVVPGLFNIKRKKMSAPKLIIASIISYVIVSMIIMTYVIAFYNANVGFFAMFTTRLIKSVEVILYIIAVPYIYNFLYKLEQRSN